MTNRRYTKESVINERFYQMPKFLFEGEFKKLSNDAKVLYTLLKDRHELSLQRGWVNSKGEVYLIYTREDMADMLGCSLKKVWKTVNELKDYGLIEEERQGLNKPNLIYLTIPGLENGGHVKYTYPGHVKYTGQDMQNIPTNNTNSSDTDINKTDIYINLPVDANPYLEIYNYYFEKKFNKPHLRVTNKQLADIEEKIDILQSYDIDLEEWERAVQEHFETLPKSNNGNIIAFLKASMRYFEIDLNRLSE